MPVFGGLVAFGSLPDDTSALVDRDEAATVLFGLRPRILLEVEAKRPSDATAGCGYATGTMQDAMAEAGGLLDAPPGHAALERFIIADIAFARSRPMLAVRATRPVWTAGRWLGRRAIMADGWRCGVQPGTGWL
ncbi:hypothetical protein IH86_15155 [Sphingobium yanoikuyae]|nr:hypothetical protein IH86_15155 [Sphingobium yanoikuyae]